MLVVAEILIEIECTKSEYYLLVHYVFFWEIFSLLFMTIVSSERRWIEYAVIIYKTCGRETITTVTIMSPVVLIMPTFISWFCPIWNFIVFISKMLQYLRYVNIFIWDSLNIWGNSVPCLWVDPRFEHINTDMRKIKCSGEKLNIMCDISWLHEWKGDNKVDRKIRKILLHQLKSATNILLIGTCTTDFLQDIISKTLYAHW